MQNQPSNSLRFVFLHGKGSSGKDTIAANLLEHTSNGVKISTGDIVRDSKIPGHKYHDLLAPYTLSSDTAGKLVPDTVMVRVVQEEIEERVAQGTRFFVFTGFPRTEPQLTATDTMLLSMQETYPNKADHIVLAVLDRHSRERAERRAQLAEQQNQPVRSDDRFEVVERRLKVYAEYVLPMLKRLQDEGRLHIVRGNRDIPRVTEQTQGYLAQEQNIPFLPQRARR